MSCSMTHRSDADEARVRNPAVSNQALYNWATALPRHACVTEKKVALGVG